MSARPQDYVSDHGRLTTNTVEGCHGLTLLYRDKGTDLGHTHYSCKTNMAICHKVINHKSTNSKSIQQIQFIEPRSNLEGFLLDENGCGHS